MSARSIIASGAATEEVTALIATLHRAGQRLHELTAGEVDTVGDAAGRTFVLQHAQDQLRRSEAARQAAILNALPAHIALLDTQGLIISVNEAWRRYAEANELPCPGYGVGVNYIDICEGVRGQATSDACSVAEGIRDVLGGRTKEYSIEYPCHSPTEQRWFLLMVTPLSEVHPNGAVVMHIDRTAERLNKEALRASELRFRVLIENVTDVTLLARLDGVLEYVSPSIQDVGGYEPSEMVGRNLFEFMHPDDALRGAKVMLDIGRSPGTPVRAELRFRHRDGSWQTLESICRNMVDVPAIRGVVVTARNVTERNLADLRIKRLNRVYSVLSGINTLIVRTADRSELFREACRIAVESGGFRMAQIGLVDGTGNIVPVASAGMDSALLDRIRELFSTTADASNTMAWHAISGKKPIVSNDSKSDPRLCLSEGCVASEVRSAATLPLMVSGEAVGVLALYATETDFFHEDEMKLLTELAADVAFGMGHLDQQERLHYLAYYDVLTGLANLSLFLERVAQFNRSANGGGHKLAVFLIDLERFKDINDSLGRSAGDELLQQVASWLTHHLQDATLLSRVDVDHFAAVLPIVWQVGDVARFLEKLIDTFLDHPFHLNGTAYRIGAKFGVAMFPDDGASAEALFKNAEAALKKSKASGSRYLFYTETMTEAVAGRLTLENQLRHALEKGEFELHYQPKINLVSGKISGAEGLIRWNDPRTGLVSPGRFIPIIEENGLIHEVGRWALRQAIQDRERWRGAGLPAPRIAVNVSPLQLRNRGFVAEIRRIIGDDSQVAAGLELELTESLIMEDVKHSIASLQAIRDMGVRIAIDDFGTGFSSLSYLSKLPIDTLKIDRSFVVDMTSTPQALGLVSTIINLAHSLKLTVVAEGVETEEQSRLLRLLSCDEMQGFLLSKAVPREGFEARFLAPSPSVPDGLSVV